MSLSPPYRDVVSGSFSYELLRRHFTLICNLSKSQPEDKTHLSVVRFKPKDYYSCTYLCFVVQVN